MRTGSGGSQLRVRRSSLSPSWSLVKHTHDLETKCVNQMRDHPPVIHRAVRESESCIWGKLCQVRADYKMSPDDEAFF